MFIENRTWDPIGITFRMFRYQWSFSYLQNHKFKNSNFIKYIPNFLFCHINNVTIGFIIKAVGTERDRRFQEINRRVCLSKR